MFGSCSANKTRAIAFFGQGMKGKLTHHQESAIHLVDIEIHGVVFIGKNAQFVQLAAEPIHIFLIISFFNSKKNHHTEPNARFYLTFDGHRSSTYPLCYYSHKKIFAKVMKYFVVLPLI